ncbi:hypothetical protein GCM10027168_44040 [Streptomyces capparidis]
MSPRGKQQAVFLALLLAVAVVTGCMTYRSPQLGNAVLAGTTVAGLAWGAINHRGP